MSNYTINGSIQNINLPGIFLIIYLHQMTGSLILTNHRHEKTIYFSEGNAAFASSNVEGDLLGETLLRIGKITQQQYDDSVRMLKETGKRQGTILMQLKYITLPELIKGVRFQLKAIIYSLFYWKDGSFKFHGNNLPINEVVTLKEDTANLVLEGCKQANCLEKIPIGIDLINSVIHAVEDKNDTESQFRFTPYESKILTFVKTGPKSVQEICDWSEYDEIETCKFLFFLLTHKVIRIENQSLL